MQTPFVGIEKQLKLQVAVERHLKLEGTWKRILKANSKPIGLLCRGKMKRKSEKENSDSGKERLK